MNTQLRSSERRSPFLAAFSIQARVIGALIMRELHTRYGRENIGYLWVVAEPLMFGSVIALMHSGSHTQHGQINPVAFAVAGYSVFIIFRGIVNRSEGALTSNLPLLHHKMVTVLDVILSRALLELAGTVSAFLILLCAAILLGFTDLPVRPLFVVIGIFYVFWIALGLSLIITAGTYERPLLERFVHPFTYFMIPLSGAFTTMVSLPPKFRNALLWIPMPHAFEMVRYGQFPGSTLEYVDFTYVTGVCMGLTLFGLFCTSTVHKRIHLS